MGKKVARAVLAICVLSALGAATACGDVNTGTKAAAQRVRPAGRPTNVLGQRELERAVLVTGDIKGHKAILVAGKVGKGDIPVRMPPVAEQPRISSEACQPIFDMLGFRSGYQGRALVVQTHGNDDSRQAPHHGVTMALASYASSDAPKVMLVLRTAGRGCAKYKSPVDGFVYSDIKASGPTSRR